MEWRRNSDLSGNPKNEKSPHHENTPIWKINNLGDKLCDIKIEKYNFSYAGFSYGGFSIGGYSDKSQKITRKAIWTIFRFSDGRKRTEDARAGWKTAEIDKPKTLSATID